MPQYVVSRINAIGLQQKMPTIITYANRYGNEVKIPLMKLVGTMILMMTPHTPRLKMTMILIQNMILKTMTLTMMIMMTMIKTFKMYPIMTMK